MKKHYLIVLVLLLSIPTFALMLRSGIFSMQDFHYFRFVEFDKCIKTFQIPCRWAPDAGAGYGEPVFNFYGQLPYLIAELFHLIGLMKIDALKITFIISLAGSSLSMFFLAKKIWKNDFSALISSVIYLYTPYRSVDVWVRGALPESLSFIFFPLIILEIENYLETRKVKHLLLFSLLASFLTINHNLSVVLFAPFLIIWSIFRFLQIREIKPFIKLTVAGIFSLLLSAFYVLPVILESKFIDINSTTVGYFDWRAHFVTIKQLLFSRFWGYGGSTWGDQDGLSLSVGQIQWILPSIIAAILILKRKINKDILIFFTLFLVGIFCLFLTHNKSTLIWTSLSFMKYIQFPWRFLGIAVFSFSIASGLFAKLLSKKTIFATSVVVILAIALNFQFFKPDIWYSVKDTNLETGPSWDEARFASIGDFWPNFGHKIPDKISDGKYINYFPGWNYLPDKNGLIPSKGAKFSNTPIRTIGNSISIVGIISFIYLFYKYGKQRNS